MQIIKRLNDGKLYKSIRACARDNNISASYVRKLALKGNGFVYVDENEVTAEDLFNSGNFAIYDTYTKQYYKTYQEAGKALGVCRQAIYENCNRFVRINGADFVGSNDGKEDDFYAGFDVIPYTGR